MMSSCHHVPFLDRSTSSDINQENNTSRWLSAGDSRCLAVTRAVALLTSRQNGPENILFRD